MALSAMNILNAKSYTVPIVVSTALKIPPTGLSGTARSVTAAVPRTAALAIQIPAAVAALAMPNPNCVAGTATLQPSLMTPNPTAICSAASILKK